MHSLNNAVLGNVVAAERAGRPSVFAQPPLRPDAHPAYRCAPARPTPRAASPAGWTARWRVGPWPNLYALVRRVDFISIVAAAALVGCGGGGPDAISGGGKVAARPSPSARW